MVENNASEGIMGDMLKNRFSKKLTHIIKGFYSNCLNPIGDSYFLVYA